ncbi:extracellular solute-binding protein [Alphaproteobacteria bacterium LSUCC0684]
MHLYRRLVLAVLLALGVVAPAFAGTLNIYSYRAPQLLAPLLEAYGKKTGTEFNVVHAPQGLAQRLQAEGASSPADIVLTSDVSRIVELAELDLLAPVSSPVIERNVPQYLREKEGRWIALSTRARILAVSKDRVAEGSISRIEDLADPKWKGRVCSRKGSHVYNRALLASLIAHHGEAEAEAWARGLVANLARKPQGNDRAQAKAIFSGECDVALMNTYYYGNMKFNTDNPEQKLWAESIRLVFLNQEDRGQHINISGGGIVRTSPRAEEARAFLEWLTEKEAQSIYASVNFEYPVNPAVSADSEVASWGSFRVDTLPIESLAEYSRAAQMIINRTGW